jgi:tRNA A37 methylthiotransferase MiaB
VSTETGQLHPAEDGKPRYYGRTRQGKTVIFEEETAANEIVSIAVERTTSHTLFGSLLSA